MMMKQMMRQMKLRMKLIKSSVINLDSFCLLFCFNVFCLFVFFNFSFMNSLQSAIAIYLGKHM